MCRVDWGDAGGPLVAATHIAAADDGNGNAHVVWAADDMDNVRNPFYRGGQGWSEIGTLGGGAGGRSPLESASSRRLGLKVSGRLR